MTRARATALALVNWKGVFYERYLLDRHVTVLEGANGAGKTTVMIAAYVVLLPDMSRLRFTNLGESGATGGDRGIWGRLGEPGRPSYTAMEIDVAGERVIAGVKLERKAEPTIEVTPFLVSGVDLGGHLKDVLLRTQGEHDEVPELSEIRQAVTERGGELTVFASAKEYFAALFDRGITPLRLATEEDRNKLNEMLRTSMTGGISRHLTTELRSFLLKEETGLSDTLSRMRKNLDACHRTRTEVAESRGLEREIAGIFDAGQAMFTAAMVAAREAAAERGAHAEVARARRDEAARDLREAERAIDEGMLKHGAVAARVLTARLARDEAAAKKDKIARAQISIRKLAELEPELVLAKKRADEALATRELRATERETWKAASARAREAYDRAAYGVGDLQSGLDELHKNVHARRRLLRRLDEVRAGLADPNIDERGVELALDRSRTRLVEVDAARARADRAVSFSAERRERHAKALAALRRIDESADPARAFEHARAIGVRFVELDALTKRIPELASGLARHEELVGRQRDVRARAEELGIAANHDESEARAAGAVVGRALDEVEAEVRAAELDALSSERSADDKRRAAAEGRSRIAQLESTLARWTGCRTKAADLAAATKLEVRSRDEAIVARARVDEDRQRQRSLVEDLRRRQEDRLREAGELEATGGAFHPDLIRIRDELDAELLAGRFEDLDPSEAAELEAALGPLAQALIVQDPVAAARALAGSPRELSDLWLVRPDAALLRREPSGAGHVERSETSRGGSHEARFAAGEREKEEPRTAAPAGDVVVEETYGARLTRMPERPSIGRVARERRAAAMREEAEKLGAELDAALKRLYELDALASAAEDVVSEGDLLEIEEPASAIERARAEADRLEAEADACIERAATSASRATSARTRVSGLRALLADAFLLDPPDHAERAAEIARALDEARASREELRRTEEDRRTLGELEDELREPPPSDEEIAAARVGRGALDAERDGLFGIIEALEDLAANLPSLSIALRSDDAERALEEKAAVAPALQAQLDAARAALAEHEASLSDAESAWEEATAAWQREQARFESARSQVQQLRTEIDEQGFSDLPDNALASAERAATERENERADLEREERALSTALALLEERKVLAKRTRDTAQGELADKEQQARPAQTAWLEVETAAGARGLLKRGLTDPRTEGASGGSATLWAEAQSKALVLVERLRRARGGVDGAAEVESTLGLGDDRARKAPGELPAAKYLDAWVATREWLRRRLPGQIAEVDDPLEALTRLRDNLALLERRLGNQESDLRGASEDVARGIDVRLRRAKAQVRRLNQSLQGIRFGNIVGIRVDMKRVERMDAVLKALREGAAQELLFLSTLPIEEALDEIFRRYGGGRSGGQKILDYREYAELAVEIQRSAEKEWEAASPTRLSTGEAIGVGAALMMVVLTEWERDGNLLRAKMPAGSMRFLFLDEANRLSQDNLGVLFSLCQNLDLQLLIAAPEVARAEGNTTYRLVRRVGEDGREEVLVSGRRTLTEAVRGPAPPGELGPILLGASPETNEHEHETPGH
ncbi:MAG: chromosome partition protein MukB [Polyangiaceae bacterium]|nr:chromosome partition protein MukB [Polyangiaceae bacterium]